MDEQSFETIQWSFDEETGVGSIVLDRPDAQNALSNQMQAEFVAGIEAFEAIDAGVQETNEGVSVQVVTVEGAGQQAFSVGGDITEFDAVNRGVYDAKEAFHVAERFQAPVVAKIDGYCLGGGLELALSCDFRFASERSTLGQPEIDIGLIPGGGGTQRLAELVGPSRTKELCMTGEHLTGTEAADEGIVDYVHQSDGLDDAVASFVNRLREKPPLAVRAVKDVVNTYQETGLRNGRRYERRVIDTLRTTEDHEEGRRAFFEDREPEWTGR